MLGFNSQEEDTLTCLLDDPDITLRDVLTHDLFMQIWRNDRSVPLIEFIVSNLDTIFEYVLTNNLETHEDYAAMRRICLIILKTTGKNVVRAFSESDKFIDKLQQFTVGENSRDPKLCGNFTKIIEILVRYTSGSIIPAKLPFLQAYLINNLDLLGLRELFYFLIISYAKFLTVNVEMFQYISEVAKEESMRGHMALVALDVIFPKKAEFIEMYQDQRVFDNITEIACMCYETDPHKSALGFSLIAQIKSRAPALPLPDQSPITSTVNAATANALRVFPGSVGLFLDRFLHLSLPTFVNESIIDILASMPDEELAELASACHMNHVLVEQFEEYRRRKTNGHFLNAGQILFHREIVCCAEHRDEWTAFVTEALLPRGRKRATTAFCYP